MFEDLKDIPSKVDDWISEGSPLANTFKFFVVAIPVATAATYILSLPFDYYEHQQANKIFETFKDFDTQPTVIFSSISDCTRKGYNKTDCDCSWEKAVDLASSMGTNLNYSTEAEAAENHQNYSKRTSKTPIIHHIGNTMTTTYVTSTHYDPAVEGWQAERNDICNSIPLYSSRNPNILLRKDMKQFKLD